MSTTITLQSDTYAFVDASSPNSNSHGQQIQQIYYPDRSTILLLHFSRLPSEYRYKKLSNAVLHARATVNKTFFVSKIAYSNSGFNASSVTYNTRPAQNGEFSVGAYAQTPWSVPSPDGSDHVLDGTFEVTGVLASDLVGSQAIWISALSPGYGFDQYTKCALHTPSSSNKPYLTVDISDDNIYLSPSISSPKNTYINPHTAQRFSWNNSASGAGSLEVPTQSSAIFYWKESTASSWNTINIPGGNNYVDVPANTLTVADTINWKVSITDSGGHSAESSTFTIYTKAGTLSATPQQPVNNYRADKTQPIVFRWSVSRTGYGPLTQILAELQYSLDQESWYTIANVNGDARNYEMPANTLSAATVYWRVRSTNIDGVVGPWSSPATFLTTDTIPTCSVLSPVDSVEDGSAPITMRWTVSNASGWAPTRVDLAYKISGSESWVYVNELAGNTRSYTFPGGTFPAGKTFWSVRAYNRDGQAGSWTNTSFVCIVAPGMPAIDTDAAPFTTFNWQGAGQQAWRLAVDGKIYGPFFGTERSYTLPDYLSDGVHTASVEIQGQYGLWSQPGTIVFTVTNVSGEEVNLSGNFEIDAELEWQSVSNIDDWLIYRDGVRIGHTSGISFIDRFVLGQHTWRVLNRLPNGMYTLSNVVTGFLNAQETVVAPFSGGPWSELRLSENANREQRFTYTRTHSLRHMRGAVYPVLELSPYLDGSGCYDVAFETESQARSFEALKGQLVIIKSRQGNVLIGALTSMDKSVKHFFIAYTFTVQRCHWEDYVDDAQG